MERTTKAIVPISSVTAKNKGELSNGMKRILDQTGATKTLRAKSAESNRQEGDIN